MDVGLLEVGLFKKLAKTHSLELRPGAVSLFIICRPEYLSISF